jgi:hypothetical protein
MTKITGLLTAGALVCALAACGGDEKPSQAPRPATVSASSDASPGKSVEDATRDMVAGVAAGKGAGLVDLKFRIQSRPEIGQPLTIEIALLPNTAAELMRATFTATEGLSVRTSEVPAEYQQVQAGSLYRHELTAVPREQGVYFISATVMVQGSAGEDVYRNFSIPVVVGTSPETEAPGATP